MKQKSQQASFSAMQEEAHMDVPETTIETETEAGQDMRKELSRYKKSEKSEKSEKTVIPINFDALKAEYSNVYAWLTVPGTNIDYAIVQHPSEDSFYLNHGYQDEYSAYGAIYTESLNKKDFSDPMTVLYGHNMKDGSMFGSLSQFRDHDFFQGHREFQIYTEDHIYTYLIFAAYVYNNDHILKKYDFTKKEDYQKYLDEIYMIRGMEYHFLDEPIATTKDRIVTLSTCVDTDHSVRYLVQGMQVKVE